MTKWEYKIKLIHGLFYDFSENLKEMGNEGWELMFIRRGDGYFKRPLSDNKE